MYTKQIVATIECCHDHSQGGHGSGSPKLAPPNTKYNIENYYNHIIINATKQNILNVAKIYTRWLLQQSKIHKFQLFWSYLNSANQDGSFDTHLAILHASCTKCHMSKYVIKLPFCVILWHIMTCGLWHICKLLYQYGYQKNRLD